MHTCIYTRVKFASSTGEHILQNFLGARWTSKSIVCDEVQAAFGKTIDVAFEKGLRPVRTLLGTKGGRGEDAPILKGLSAASGEIVDFEPGGKPRLNRPVVNVTQDASGPSHKVQIKLGHKGQAGWALAEIKKKIPGVTITEEEILKMGTAGRGYIQGAVKVEIKIGGQDYIRGALKACFNLLAVSNVPVLDSCFDPARNFILNGTGNSSDFLRWPRGDNNSTFPSIGAIDQFVGIASRGSKVEGIIRLFGGMPHAVRISNTYSGQSFKIGYLVDPLREGSPAENRNPTFSDQILPDFDLQPEKPGSESWAAMEEAITRVGRVYQGRSQSEMVKETVEEVLLPYDGKPLTKEQLDEIKRKVTMRFLRIDEI